MDYLELAVSVRSGAVEAAADLLRRHVPAGVSIEAPYEAVDEEGGVALDEGMPVRLRAWLPLDSEGTRAGLSALRRDLRALGDAVVRPLGTRTVSDTSWAGAWKRHFRVMRVGRRLVIRPSWRSYRPRKDDIVINLDPGMAFGTGQHETTKMCLQALEERPPVRGSVLDLGCGSGILSIAAALLGARRVDALDIDPVAVKATRENADRNGIVRDIRVGRGSLGETWPFPESAAGRYDLVLANLSARIVGDLGQQLVAALRPGGAALVSGIVQDQEAACRDALAEAGGQVVGSRGEGEWRLLVVERGAGKATGRSPRTSRSSGLPRRRGQ